MHIYSFIVEGTIIAIEKDLCRIETIDGTLSIPILDILEETVNITKKNGSRYDGPLIKESPEEIVVRSEYGDVVISKKDIRDMDRYHGGKLVPQTRDTKRFYQGEAKLINNFLDPTAFVLDAQTFYLSGLSVGYGFTDNFMLTTKFGSGFAGDLNIHPKIRLYHRQTGTSEQAVAVGVALHRRYSMKSLWQNIPTLSRTPAGTATLP